MMDASTISAIAALVVAFAALLVAFAQALQQYLVSGQLIRICDSVVYGKMPGQGHRVWEFSQFRFRIVYSVPKIGLANESWLQASKQGDNTKSQGRISNLTISESKVSRSSIAGEASWVSFTRTVQYASGNSIRYEMVEGDADRCPTDLPVVPMQLSMRDVVAMAVMAGMECTDVSFEAQSLSMQGSAGTITSSRHPIIGALIHFAPRQPFKNHGIPTNTSTLDASWLARLSDVISVAGSGYDERDRRHFEEDDGSWIRSSREMALHTVRDAKKTTPVVANQVRRRRTIRKAPSEQSLQEDPPVSQHLTITRVSLHGRQDLKNCLHRPQDGSWSFSLISSSAQEPLAHGRTVPAAVHSQPSYQGGLNGIVAKLSQRLYGLLKLRNDHDGSSVLPTSEPKLATIQNLAPHRPDTANDPAPISDKASGARIIQGKSSQRQLDTQNLDDHVREKSHLATSKQDVVLNSRKGSSQLLLTDSQYNEGSRSSILTAPSEQQLDVEDDARTKFVVQKWQDAFEKRQRMRSRHRSVGSWLDPMIARQRAQRRSDETAGGFGSINGVVTNRNQVSVDARRISTWPLRREPDIRLKKSHTFPKGTKAPEFLRPRKHREELEYKSPLHVTSRRNLSWGVPPSVSTEPFVDHHDKSVPLKGSRTGKVPLPIERFHIFEVESPPTKSRSDSQDTHSAAHNQPPMIRRGRRRNSSVTRTRPVLGNANGQFAYGNGPVTDRQLESTGANPSRPRPTSSKISPKRRVRMVSPTRSPSTSSRDSRDHELESPYKRPIRMVSPPPSLSVSSRDSRDHHSETPSRRRLRMESPTRSLSTSSRESRDHVLKSPASPSSGTAPIKGILKKSRERFPEAPNFIREGVAPIKLAPLDEQNIPREARWTKIDRRLVSTAALDKGNERYEATRDYVIVLRVLTKHEIQDYAMQTTRLREYDENRRHRESDPTPTSDKSRERNVGASPVYDSDDSGGSFERIPSNQAASPQAIEVGINMQRRDRIPYEPDLVDSEDLDANEIESPLTYQDELIFIDSENILRYIRRSTEQCNDVSVTLQNFLDDRVSVDARIDRTLECLKNLKETLPQILLIIEPLKNEKKVAIFVTQELNVLTQSMRISLDSLENDFAHFDIIPLPLEARRQKWEKLMLAFEEENPCSLPEHLGLSYRYASEALANIRAGILSTPESKLAKSRLCAVIGVEPNLAPGHSDGPNDEQVLKNAHEHRNEHRSFSPNLQLSLKAVPKRRYSSNRSNDVLFGQSDREHSSDDEDRSSTSSTLAESILPVTGGINWFWLCQADIIPGYWATPWKYLVSEAVCLGGISVVLKVLEQFTNPTSLKYVKPRLSCLGWIRAGKTTYPSFAHNSKGGVVVSGAYEPVKFAAFDQVISAIELLYSYEYQVDRSPLRTTQSVTDSLGELMGLDSWLSMAGRLSEITQGPSDLLRTLPFLIQRIMTEFHLEFLSLDRTSNDGGLQIIQTIAEALLQTFRDQNFSVAEQLFASVALLRTAKVGLSIVRGPDTSKLEDVLRHDVQVYMA